MVWWCIRLNGFILEVVDEYAVRRKRYLENRRSPFLWQVKQQTQGRGRYGRT